MERATVKVGEYSVSYAKGYTRGEVSRITKDLYGIASAGKDNVDLQKAMSITEDSLTILIKEVKLGEETVEVSVFLEEVGNAEFQALQKLLQEIYNADPTFKELEEAGKKALADKKAKEEASDPKAVEPKVSEKK